MQASVDILGRLANSEYFLWTHVFAAQQALKGNAFHLQSPVRV